MEWTRKKAWRVVWVYLSLIFVSLYFTPFLGQFLVEQKMLGTLVNATYGFAALVLFYLFYFEWKIRNPMAYGFAVVLIFFFLAAFSRMEVSTDRLHFLEHGLLYLFFYLALSFSCRGVVLVGRTIFFCILIAFVDEGLQGILPNRNASLSDVWANIFAYYLAAGLVAIVHQYRAFPYGKKG